MDIETNPSLPSGLSNPYMLTSKHQKWVRKELEDLKEQELSRETFLHMHSQ